MTDISSDDMDSVLPDGGRPVPSLPIDAATRSSQDVELATEVRALTQLPVEQMNLRELLIQVATFAVRVIPGADGAGLTLLEPGLPDVIIKTTDFVGPIDTIQYSLREGPCISAAAQRRAMRSGSLKLDPRWPEFGPRAAALGVHSVLSLPLVTAGKAIGAMNVYAHAPDSFDARAEMLGMSFAVPAAETVRHAQILEQTFRLATHLQTAADSHSLIYQAVGILRNRNRYSADAAQAELRQLADSIAGDVEDAARAVMAAAARRLPSQEHEVAGGSDPSSEC